jgi:hypothetical protein
MPRLSVDRLGAGGAQRDDVLRALLGVGPMRPTVDTMTAPLASRDLADRRTLDGPGRLLKELIKRGLPEEHLRAAVALVVALDKEARR